MALSLASSIGHAVRRAKALIINEPVPLSPAAAKPSVIIIGSGIGGLGMAIRLRQLGLAEITILEKAASLGGTWRDNTYPGSACDVPSHLYSLSFAPNPNWSRKFPTQPEILEHLEQTADDFDLRNLIRFGSAVVSATFEERTSRWTVALDDGSVLEADLLVAATGQLSRPFIPDIDGLEFFSGEVFHSARWNHDHDLTNAKVAVVGIGASAIQFVPAIADQVESLTLFQRTVNHVAPKPDGPFSDRTKRIFRSSSLVRRAYRASIWVRFDIRFLGFLTDSRIGRWSERRFVEGLSALTKAGLSAEHVIPNYRAGCRRILVSNDWYPTLMRSSVEVVSAPVERVEAGGIVAGGELHEADTIIFGTGFQATDFLGHIEVVGAEGRKLSELWVEGAEAHLGIGVSGFPNMFLLYGPNTNLGHNSIIFMIEQQIHWITQTISHMVENGGSSVDVRPEAQRLSNDRLRRELAETVWASDCHSWYRNAAGKITNNWSRSSFSYWLRTRRVNPNEIDIR